MAPILVILGVPIISILVTVGIHRKDAMNAYLMGFFRDVSRIKSTKRHMKQNPNAMVTTTTAWDIVLQRDDPLAGIDFSSTDNTNDDSTISSLATFTVKELEELGNGRNGSKIYLSVFGRVYDVSTGEKFYGPNSSYWMFAGKDVTRGLCLGCKEPECLVRSTEGLNEKQINEGRRWLSFFELHDRYHHIGNMEKVDSEKWLDALVLDSIVRDAVDDDA